MCGIFGIWCRNRSGLDLENIHYALTSIRHRGPDDEGYLFIDSSTGRYFPTGGPDTPQSVLTSNFGYSPKSQVDQLLLNSADLVIANRRRFSADAKGITDY